MPGPPSRPAARHGHGLVKEAARCLQRLVRQAAGSPAHEAASPAAVYMLPSLAPPIPNPNPTPLPPLAVVVVSSRSLSIRRLELAAARLELAGPAPVTSSPLVHLDLSSLTISSLLSLPIPSSPLLRCTM